MTQVCFTRTVVLLMLVRRTSGNSELLIPVLINSLCLTVYGLDLPYSEHVDLTP